MLDPTSVLDRFGDEEFLRELWLKARRQLPDELASVDELRCQNVVGPELGKRLHKLRGLIANFLEGGDAIAKLRRCEELCRQSGGQVATPPWQEFVSALYAESAQLEGWLEERGFPC